MKKSEPILTEYLPVFSGGLSEDLWESINSVNPPVSILFYSKSKERIHDALYEMGVACQNLESKVEKLQRRISQLELKSV